jgi:hypothetical protein
VSLYESCAKDLLYVYIDLVHGTIAVYRLKDAVTLIVVDERLRLILIGIQTLLNGLGLVVITLIHLASTTRAGIDACRSGISAASTSTAGAETLYDNVKRHVYKKGSVKLDAHLGKFAIERLGLGDVGRESGKHEALLCIRLG